MSAETLRRAAAEMRQDDQGPVMHAVADLLDHEADAFEQHRASATTLRLRVAPALAVANAYLGEPA